MKNSNFILLYWKEEQKVFNKNFEILCNGPDKKAVHDIRVAIKKLRACLKLHAIIAEKKDPIAVGWQDLFTETKNLFAVLGKERDVEMCLELLTDAEKKSKQDYSNIKNYLQSMLQTKQSWSLDALKNYFKTELANLTLLLSHGADEPAKEWLIKKTIDAINNHLHQIKDYYKQPHKIRKLLKDVYYWLKMLPKNAVAEDSLEKKLEKMLDDFGNWQNDEMLLAKTKHFRKDNLPDSFGEYGSLKTLEQKVEERKEKLLKEVLTKTRQLPKKISSA
jgi:CHAD domain-containing protein